jgi:DNA-binding HxlR family transcriptional regulator
MWYTDAMTPKPRSYHQYCPIAHTLDVVGDRWALLIVRDLLVGPKRFVDLRTSLKGIVTNILTDRLRELEAAGVLTRRYLPPPAASMVYELTEAGLALEPVLAAMAHWGGRSLGTPQPEQTVSSESVRLALANLLRPLAATPAEVYVAVVWNEPPFSASYTARCGNGQVEVAPATTTAAALRLELDVATLFAVSSGQRLLDDAFVQGDIAVDGADSLVARLRAAEPHG